MFEFTEEQLMLRDMVREFAANEVAPLAAEIDETKRFPQETIKKMGDLGLMGIPVPEEYGGAGMDNVSYIIAVHELSKACASTGLTLAAHTSLGTEPILKYGTEEQKRKYLPALASGEYLGAFGLTEPNAGSDAGGTQTTAVRDGDSWVINGTKIFCTNAGYAGTVVITALTDRGQEKKGISSFIVEKDTPGFTLSPPEDKMGWRASDTRQLFFEDCRIPAENLLGELNRGFRQFLTILDGGRISIAAVSLGIAEAAFEAAVKYSKERSAFGKPICEFQGVSFPLAKIRTELEAAKLLTYRAAWLKDQGKDYAYEAAMAKYFASELAMRASIQAIQTHGGYGYIKEFPVERYFRDAKVCTIGEGTSEILLWVISRSFLKD